MSRIQVLPNGISTLLEAIGTAAGLQFDALFQFEFTAPVNT